MTTRPLVFMSYTQFDNDFEDGALSQFRDALSRTLRFFGGDEITIFQESTDVEIGQQIQECISQALGEVMVLVPVLTPNFFTDATCQSILRRFLERERQLGRNDLVLAMHYQHVPALANPQAHDNALIRDIGKRRLLNWQSLRGKDLRDPQVQKELEGLARRIIAILHEPRTSTTVPFKTLSPDQRIGNSVSNQGVPGNFYGPEAFMHYDGLKREQINQAVLNTDLQSLADLVWQSQSPYEHRSPREASADQNIVVLATRDQRSSSHYVEVARAFVVQYSASFTGGVFWFDQRAAGEDITVQVTRHGRAAAIQLRTDFDTLDQPYKLAAVQRAWQEPVSRLLIFSGIDSDDAVKQLGAVLPRTGGSCVLIISRWYELTRLAQLDSDRCMKRLSAEQVAAFSTIIAVPASSRAAEYAYDPCIHQESFPKGASAETEEYLAEVFCRPSIYRGLSNPVRNPVSHVVFGAKGTGKTALCKMLEKEYRHHRKVLTIRPRTNKIQQQVQSQKTVTIDSWIEALLPQLLKSLVGRLRHEPRRLQKLKAHSSEADQLYGLCAVFGVDPLGLSEPTQAQVLCDRITRHDSFERLEILSDILAAGDFQYARILIDDINNRLFETTLEQATSVISPLLEWLGDLQERRLAVIFFLPDTLRGRADTGLIHKMNDHEIKWTDDDLKKIVQRRLANLGTLHESAVEETEDHGPLDSPERFALLCESDMASGGSPIDEVLIHYAQQRPGKLIHIINSILAKHCTDQQTEPATPISRATIESVLATIAYD